MSSSFVGQCPEHSLWSLVTVTNKWSDMELMYEVMNPTCYPACSNQLLYYCSFTCGKCNPYNSPNSPKFYPNFPVHSNPYNLLNLYKTVRPSTKDIMYNYELCTTTDIVNNFMHERKVIYSTITQLLLSAPFVPKIF